MRIGVHLRHWDRTPHDVAALAKVAEEVGLDSVWVSETWGSDATVLATWIAAHTSRISIGTGILQMPARTPAATAMAAATIDHLSRGRLRLGPGAGGPRVAEGWHGVAYGSPLARIRDARAVGARSRGAIALRWPDLHGACSRRRGPVAEDERRAAPERRADLLGRDGPEERRADEGDRRRLVAASVQPGARGCLRARKRGRRLRRRADGADRDRG